MKNLHGQSVDIMEKPNCNLKFQRHTYNFVNLLDDFRLKELYCDATIACDGKKYSVHQVVLSACSDFFASLFANAGCHNPLVVLQDVSPSHLESLLDYIYKGEVHVPQCELQAFMKAAKSLFIKGLMIPHLEKYVIAGTLSGTWHESYVGPEVERTRRMHPRSGNLTTPPTAGGERLEVEGKRHPHVPRLQQVQRDDMTNNPPSPPHPHPPPPAPPSAAFMRSGPAGVPMNGMVVDTDYLRRRSVMEHEQYMPVDRRLSHKRPHYMAEFPHDLRIPHEVSGLNRDGSKDYDHSLIKNRAEMEEGDKSYEFLAKDSAVIYPVLRGGDTAGQKERKRLKSTEAKEREHQQQHYREDKNPTLNGYSSSLESHGTFQKLVADESPIKQEPLDEEEELLEGDLKVELDECPLKGDDCSDDYDEEEAPLHISEDQDDLPPLDHQLVPHTRCNNDGSEANDNSKSYLQMPPDTYSRSSDHLSAPTPGHLSPNSQLRRELMRPVPQNAMLLQQQQQQRPQAIPQSIPHPVIASRESQVQVKPHSTLREPPPLMKIPEKLSDLMSDSECVRAPPVSPIKDLQVNKGNSHLLVSAPPTYRSNNNAPNVFFEIHNKQLGPILVNGGSHISSGSHSAFSPAKPTNDSSVNNNSNLFGYDSEGPLNLSGFQKPSAINCDLPVNGDDNGDPFLGKIVTNRKKRLRGPKSWEFLVRLLRDPTTNPDLIRWEHESNGIFRLVQPAVIAQRWGRRTGKHASENLSYENFARGLRYHYATGALKPVSEKSFVYRFGPKAVKLLEECDAKPFPYI